MAESGRFARVAGFLGLLAAILAASALRFFEPVELTTLDLRYHLRGVRPTHPDVVIVEIANDAIERLGRWPFARSWHAHLIEALTQAGAKAIVFDILFAEPSPDDEALVTAASASGRVYFPVALRLKTPSRRLVQASAMEVDLLPPLRAAARGIGHINIVTDRDGKNRRVPPVIHYERQLIPLLSLRVACDALGVSPEAILRRIPIDDEGLMLIDFAGPWQKTFKHYSYFEILQAYAQLQAGQPPAIDLSVFKDKICFVGLTATGLHDLNPTPLEPRYPMIGVHANVANMMLLGTRLRRLSRTTNLLILLGLALLTIGLLWRRKPWVGVSIALGMVALVTGVAIGLFRWAGVWMDAALPVTVVMGLYGGMTVQAFLKEQRHRELLEKELAIARQIQQSFLPPSPPASPEVEIAVTMRPAKEVGGDLYQFIQPAPGLLGILIGDVSGKGIPAALMMARVVSEFKIWARAANQPAEVLMQMNQSLVQGSSSGLFVTACYLMIPRGETNLSIANAGHLSLLRMSDDGQEVKEIDVEGGVPLGLIAETNYPEVHIPFQAGDCLVLYTDGVLEAWNARKEDYGVQRMTQVMQAHRGASAATILESLMSDVARFVGRTPQHDDLTAIVIKRRAIGEH